MLPFELFVSVMPAFLFITILAGLFIISFYTPEIRDTLWYEIIIIEEELDESE